MDDAFKLRAVSYSIADLQDYIKHVNKNMRRLLLKLQNYICL